MAAQEVITAWREDEAFRDLFIAELAASPYEAFFWEMPPLQSRTVGNPFECVVIRSEALTDVKADPSDFVSEMSAAQEGIAVFLNLGGDATLIVPSKLSGLDCYGHFAAFLREGPREQQHALFQALAEEAGKLLRTGKKFWISTSGLGVPWLHVRLDSRPKYYQYRPYAEA
ncbi:MAG: hypothetical protein JOY77_12950 [Alphaproteobacteria bacterium]|nr:hypothetical protein [Alphaproteobacteria bacterium]MBV9063818.1 hypothetical protein [Alphaproteobacteria bacterium]